MIVGIYGKSGSGKSTLCKYLHKKGFYIIDTDVLGHNILKRGNEGYSAVINAFGKDFLDSHGEIDRKKLGAYVFSEHKADLLSALTHPIITKAVEEEIKRAQTLGKNIAVDGALLHTTKIKDMCNIMILVKSGSCISRIEKRDDLDENSAKKRIESQNIPETAEYIIENDSTLQEMFDKADEILKGMNIDYE